MKINLTDERFKRIKFDGSRFPVLIEISKGMKNKYEIDKETGLLRLDRILYTSTHYPQNYGYIPLTLCDDGDPMDVLVVSSEELLPLSYCMARPIGVVRMLDNGRRDDKILAVPIKDPFYSQINSINDLPKHLVDEIIHFFSVYKVLEGKETAVGEVGDEKLALELINESIALFNKTNK